MKLTLTAPQHAELVALYLASHYNFDPRKSLTTFFALCRSPKPLTELLNDFTDLPEWLVDTVYNFGRAKFTQAEFEATTVEIDLPLQQARYIVGHVLEAAKADLLNIIKALRDGEEQDALQLMAQADRLPTWFPPFALDVARQDREAQNIPGITTIHA